MSTSTPSSPADWPRYCCAILRDAAGRYLLERRPPDAAAAAGLLTCFGGTRLDGEHPEVCIRRELREELGVDFARARLKLSVRLIAINDEDVAWFYRGVAPHAEHIVAEPGVEIVWAASPEQAGCPLSPWHATALAADRNGETVAIAIGTSRG